MEEVTIVDFADSKLPREEKYKWQVELASPWQNKRCRFN